MADEEKQEEPRDDEQAAAPAEDASKDKAEDSPSPEDAADKGDEKAPAEAGADEASAAAEAPEGEASEGEDNAPEKPVQRPRGQRQVSYGIAHVKATFNNTIVSIADTAGRVIGWSSGGRAGFKGARKSTSFAAGVVGQEAARHALARGIREVEVRVQGPGAGRETAIRALQSSGLTISVIKDVTPIPHNGCRPRKRRRV